MADVFVSYSRRDSEFVRRLVEELQARGKEVWLDVEGIRDGEVFPPAPDAFSHRPCSPSRADESRAPSPRSS